MAEDHANHADRRRNWLTRLVSRRPAQAPAADPLHTTRYAVEQVRQRLASGEWEPSSDQPRQRVPWNLPTTFPTGTSGVRPAANGHPYPN